MSQSNTSTSPLTNFWPIRLFWARKSMRYLSSHQILKEWLFRCFTTINCMNSIRCRAAFFDNYSLDWSEVDTKRTKIRLRVWVCLSRVKGHALKIRDQILKGVWVGLWEWMGGFGIGIGYFMDLSISHVHTHPIHFPQILVSTILFWLKFWESCYDIILSKKKVLYWTFVSSSQNA